MESLYDSEEEEEMRWLVGDSLALSLGFGDVSQRPTGSDEDEDDEDDEEDEDEDVDLSSLALPHLDQEPVQVKGHRIVCRTPPPSPPTRSLHEKLSSPERMKKSPTEVARAAEAKHRSAEANRERLESQRRSKLREAASRVRDVSERQARKLAEAELSIREKLDRAEAAKQAHLQQIRRKAESENMKVDEVEFINNITIETKRLEMQRRLESTEARRKEHLQTIVAKQEKRPRPRLSDVEPPTVTLEMSKDRARARKRKARKAKAQLAMLAVTHPWDESLDGWGSGRPHHSHHHNSQSHLGTPTTLSPMSHASASALGGLSSSVLSSAAGPRPPSEWVTPELNWPPLTAEFRSAGVRAGVAAAAASAVAAAAAAASSSSSGLPGVVASPIDGGSTTRMFQDPYTGHRGRPSRPSQDREDLSTTTTTSAPPSSSSAAAAAASAVSSASASSSSTSRQLHSRPPVAPPHRSSQGATPGSSGSTGGGASSTASGGGGSGSGSRRASFSSTGDRSGGGGGSRSTASDFHAGHPPVSPIISGFGGDPGAPLFSLDDGTPTSIGSHGRESFASPPPIPPPTPQANPRLVKLVTDLRASWDATLSVDAAHSALTSIVHLLDTRSTTSSSSGAGGGGGGGGAGGGTGAGAGSGAGAGAGIGSGAGGGGLGSSGGLGGVGFGGFVGGGGGGFGTSGGFGGGGFSGGFGASPGGGFGDGTAFSFSGGSSGGFGTGTSGMGGGGGSIGGISGGGGGGGGSATGSFTGASWSGAATPVPSGFPPGDIALLRKSGAIDIACQCANRETVTFNPKGTEFALRLVMVSCSSPVNRAYLLRTNRGVALVDVLLTAFEAVPDDVFAPRRLMYAMHRDMVLVMTAMDCVWLLLRHTPTVPDSPEAEVQDALQRYIVHNGVVDHIAACFNTLRGSPNLAVYLPFVHSSLALLESLTATPAAKARPVYSPAGMGTPPIVPALRSTNLAGLPTLLVSVLITLSPSFHQTRRRRSPSGKVPCPALPDNAVVTALLVLKVLNNTARLDLSMVQTVLGEPGMQLEFQHAVDLLLTHANYMLSPAPAVGWDVPEPDDAASVPSPHAPLEEMLAELIVLVGYYVLARKRNQETLAWGRHPTPLRRLCLLPFRYFMAPHLQDILFPTLIAAVVGCVQNRDTLREELSPALLVDFLKSRRAGYLSGSPSDPILSPADGVALVPSGDTVGGALPADPFAFVNRFPEILCDASVAFLQGLDPDDEWPDDCPESPRSFASSPSPSPSGARGGGGGRPPSEPSSD